MFQWFKKQERRTLFINQVAEQIAGLVIQSNKDTQKRIEDVQKDLTRIENEKIERLVALLADVAQALLIIATVEERAGPSADERLRIVLEKLENIIEHRDTLVR